MAQDGRVTCSRFLWDYNGDGIFYRGPGSTFVKTWSPPATYENRRFESSLSARMYPDPSQGAFQSTTAGYYPVKIRLSVNVGTDHLPDRQKELDLLDWGCTDPITFDNCPNPFFPKQPTYWNGLTVYAKAYWDPPWQGEVKIWGVQIGPKSWKWKNEETRSYVYHEKSHCLDMEQVRDNEESMWHKLVEQVGPFWIAATEMKAFGPQALSSLCSYKCVHEGGAIYKFAENYGYTNEMAMNAPLTEDVRAWLRGMVEMWYGFFMKLSFPKILWGEGDYQHKPQIGYYHISPPKWRTYDPCD